MSEIKQYKVACGLLIPGRVTNNMYVATIHALLATVSVVRFPEQLESLQLTHVCMVWIPDLTIQTIVHLVFSVYLISYIVSFRRPWERYLSSTRVGTQHRHYMSVVVVPSIPSIHLSTNNKTSTKAH